MSNHIIIGLGGTGGKIIRAFKQRYFEEFHDTKAKGFERVNLDFIYVDSNKKDLDEPWVYYGNDLGLSSGRKLNINEVNSAAFHNLHSFPRLNSFISDADAAMFTQDANLRSIISAGIGGQRRRFGRVLFANKSNEFMNLVNNCMTELQNRSTSGEAAVTFHICAGLAGGTGSGSVIDVVSQLANKNTNRDHPEYDIYLYLYVPGSENLLDTKPEFKYYYANGYAALLELNALSAHRYYPVDVTRGRDSQGNVIRLLEGRNAFKVAYLYSEVNCGGRRLDRNERLPQMVGDFIFQRTVAPALVNGGEKELERVIDAENAGMTINESSGGMISHATNFLSLGVKRIEVPVTEIKEFISFRFALQATYQMLYNTFEEGKGYIERPSVMDFKREITQATYREKIHISDDYMMGLKSLDNNGIVYPAEEEIWKTKAAALHKKIAKNDEKVDWKDQFQSEFGQFYLSGWHGRGVGLYYGDRRSNIHQYALLISNHIEKQLFDEWNMGQKSLCDVSRLLSIIIDYCSGERLRDFNKAISILDSKNTDIEKNIDKINARWQNPLFGKKKMFEDYVQFSWSLYCNRMKIEGYKFAAELTPYVVRNLSQIKEYVDKEIKRLLEELEYFKYEYLKRCKEDENPSDSEIEKVYGGADGLDKIRKMAESFIVDRKLMDSNSKKVRDAIKRYSMGGINTFQELYDRLNNVEYMQNMINYECIGFTESILNQSEYLNDTTNILRVNILELLKKQYPAGAKLRDYMKRLIDNAYYHARFSGVEIGNGGGIEPGRMIELIIPEYESENDDDYRNAFIEEFKQAVGDGNCAVLKNNRFNQIVIMSLPTCFPVRYMDIVSVLHERYDDMTKGVEGSINKMVMHTETEDVQTLRDRKVDYMSLFNMTENESKGLLRPYILLLFALDLPEKTNDPQGMNEYIWAYITRDDAGNPIKNGTIQLGANIVDSVDVVVKSKNDPEACSKLIGLINDTLRKNEYRTLAAKKELRKRVGEIVRNQVLPLCNNEEFNPTYEAFLKAMEHINENILKINE